MHGATIKMKTCSNILIKFLLLSDAPTHYTKVNCTQFVSASRIFWTSFLLEAKSTFSRTKRFDYYMHYQVSNPSTWKKNTDVVIMRVLPVKGRSVVPVTTIIMIKWADCAAGRIRNGYFASTDWDRLCRNHTWTNKRIICVSCVSLRSAFLCEFTQRETIAYCRRFGIIYRIPSSGIKQWKKKGQWAKFFFFYQWRRKSYVYHRRLLPAEINSPYVQR
jgi:hypothetical protein